MWVKRGVWRESGNTAALLAAPAHLGEHVKRLRVASEEIDFKDGLRRRQVVLFKLAVQTSA